MVNFTSDELGDGIPRCTKHFQVRLTRDQTRFCIEQTGQSGLDEDAGGGTKVDAYLRDLLIDALDARMSRFAAR